MTYTPDQLVSRTTETLGQLRSRTPLVQCLTNSVVVNFTANALLAVGAAAAMVDIPEEAGAFAGVAGGLLVNLGTPTAEQRTAMLEAVEAATAAGTPWVLDPVAAGTLPVRTPLAHRLRDLRPTIVRGNASEIIAVAGSGSGGRGVDATDDVDGALDAARALATTTGGVVAVSGPVDAVTDGRQVVRIANGHPLLTRVTGGGCALGAVMAAFAAIESDPLAATVAADHRSTPSPPSWPPTARRSRKLRRPLPRRAGRHRRHGDQEPGPDLVNSHLHDLDLSVYLVTDTAMAAARGRDVPGTVAAAVAGGVTAVQVRDKDAPAAQFLATVLAVAEILPERVALVVNDRVDVFLAARAAGARVTGVHVGQTDLPVTVVRELVGDDVVIGLSAATTARGGCRCHRPRTGGLPGHRSAAGHRHQGRCSTTTGPGRVRRARGGIRPASGGDRRHHPRRHASPAPIRRGRRSDRVGHLRGP